MCTGTGESLVVCCFLLAWDQWGSWARVSLSSTMRMTRRLTYLLTRWPRLSSVLKTNYVPSDLSSSCPAPLRSVLSLKSSFLCLLRGYNQLSRELPGLLQWPLPSSLLSSSAHLQHQRTRWSHTMSFWHYQSLVLSLCLSGFLDLKENSYYAMRPPEKQALPGTSLTSIHLGFLSVAPVTVKSLGGCPLLSCDWNLKRDLQQELNRSKIWMPDLPEHGWGEEGHHWSHCDVEPLAIQDHSALPI